MSSSTSTALFPATGAFYTSDGQIIGPNGEPFVARGIDVMEGNQPTVGQLQSDFPGINFVRLAIYDYASPAALAAYVTSLTAAGIVVELEDHANSNGSNAGGGSGTIFTGSQLSNELNCTRRSPRRFNPTRMCGLAPTTSLRRSMPQATRIPPRYRSGSSRPTPRFATPGTPVPSWSK